MGDSDCDDSNATTNPIATDIVGDGIDQNCDNVDGTDSDDGDASMASGGMDCDDMDSMVDSMTDADGDGVMSLTVMTWMQTLILVLLINLAMVLTKTVLVAMLVTSHSSETTISTLMQLPRHYVVTMM